MVSRIRSLCEARGITVAQLEREVIISNGSISKWDKSSPKADNLYKVATYFGVTMEYLLTGKENPAERVGGTETDNMIIDILSRVDPSVRQSVLDFLVSLESRLSNSDAGQAET